MEENYEKILEKISKIANVEPEELERKIEAKRAKLAGLISKEGAAQIVAAELGISFDNERLKINELLPGMRKINFIGKVISVSPVRTFTTKKGDMGKVTNLLLADETSNIKAVLWDTNHIEKIEKGEIKKGDVIEISNSTMRDNEVHLGSFSEFKLVNDVLNDVKTERVLKGKKIVDFRVGEGCCVRAFVVQVFEPKFFHVCPNCKKKPNTEGENFICVEHGKIVPEKRALINIVLDDGTESIRSVLFHENISKLGLTELENPDLVEQQKQNLLGKEMVFSGDVRNNKFFNNAEFIINEVKEINLDELIKELEDN